MKARLIATLQCRIDKATMDGKHEVAAELADLLRTVEGWRERPEWRHLNEAMARVRQDTAARFRVVDDQWERLP